MARVETVTIRTADLGDVDGMWDPDTRIIWLHQDLTPAERRCTLAHEIIHAARGDEHCRDHVLNARQERLVDEIASRLLIPLDLLADALVWCHDDAQLCDALDVDLDTLDARRRFLTLEERHYLSARISTIEHVA
ncbi:MAG: ImmA/IrrE family metallo-endopeptidase [Candidatus Nanopelagicales bacterium]|nr:ImmA/IrrE family metallo-endopeptidase [Candidatus Nanopelagicales bacterium]